MEIMKDDSEIYPKAGNPGCLASITRWRHYSVTFGLILPVICFALEFVLLPALGWLPGLVFFHRFRIFGYGVVGLELVTLATWLKFGPRLGRWSAGFAGVMLAGSMFSGVLGVVLFPFAVPGILVVGIGLLGLVPLFTSHVYYRHGMEAYRQAAKHVGMQAKIEALLWGAVLVYLVPGLIQARVTINARRLMNEVIAGNEQAANTATVALRRY